MTEHEHLVKSYTAELEALDVRIARLGAMAQALLDRAFLAIERLDAELAETAIPADAAIDALDLEIEEQAIAMIARRQPMALDLRHIASAMKISNELERIGDLAKNIAKRTLVIARYEGTPPPLTGLKRMYDLARQQLADVLDAYAARDADMALAVWRRDEQLDAAYNSAFRDLLTYMMEDPRTITPCTHFLFAAKNLERIGDHATNIAERVHFLVRGVAPSDHRPKGDDTYQYTPEK